MCSEYLNITTCFIFYEDGVYFYEINDIDVQIVVRLVLSIM